MAQRDDASRRALQTKRYVAEVNGAHGHRFRVFTTGDDRYYLFVSTHNPVIFTPVAKSALQPVARSALRHGWGHAPRRHTA